MLPATISALQLTQPRHLRTPDGLPKVTCSMWSGLCGSSWVLTLCSNILGVFEGLDSIFAKNPEMFTNVVQKQQIPEAPENREISKKYPRKTEKFLGLGLVHFWKKNDRDLQFWTENQSLLCTPK